MTKKIYEQWKQNAKTDPDLFWELDKINDNKEEIYERFYCDLTFGTAGLRGIIGAGTNRMNIYTVNRATLGLAKFLKQKYLKPSVAISFDSRIKSELFARTAAKALASCGIKVYITKELAPTPLLSFAVRNLNCSAGIMITASHNPAKYNGYKCYDETGCQITGENANQISKEIQNINYFGHDDVKSFESYVEKGIIRFIDNEIFEKYLQNVKKQQINTDLINMRDLSLVFTPLNGAGNKLVRSILNQIGIKNINIVKEQEKPDGNFPTCNYPNPEFKEALFLALELAKKTNSELILATDPDSDRLGVVVKNKDDYKTLTGNEIGLLLTYYILSQKSKKNTLPKEGIIIKTIVSTDIVEKIAKKYGCKTLNVLTGFKYIGEQIGLLENEKKENLFQFGFEESYGYLAGTYVRDKDAVVAAMLMCEMITFFKEQNQTLVEVLEKIYNEFGHYKNITLNYGFEGAHGALKMQKIMQDIRKTNFKEICGLKVLSINDYKDQKTYDLENETTKNINLPVADVFSFTLQFGNKIIIRPSGTEPKIKIYLTCAGENENDLKLREKELNGFIKNILNIK